MDARRASRPLADPDPRTPRATPAGPGRAPAGRRTRGRGRAARRGRRSGGARRTGRGIRRRSQRLDARPHRRRDRERHEEEARTPSFQSARPQATARATSAATNARRAVSCISTRSRPRRSPQTPRAVEDPGRGAAKPAGSCSRESTNASASRRGGTGSCLPGRCCVRSCSRASGIALLLLTWAPALVLGALLLRVCRVCRGAERLALGTDAPRHHHGEALRRPRHRPPPRGGGSPRRAWSRSNSSKGCSVGCSGTEPSSPARSR